MLKPLFWFIVIKNEWNDLQQASQMENGNLHNELIDFKISKTDAVNQKIKVWVNKLMLNYLFS